MTPQELQRLASEATSSDLAFNPDAFAEDNAFLAACSPELIAALAGLWRTSKPIEREHAAEFGSWWSCDFCEAVRGVEAVAEGMK